MRGERGRGTLCVGRGTLCVRGARAWCLGDGPRTGEVARWGDTTPPGRGGPGGNWLERGGLDRGGLDGDGPGR